MISKARTVIPILQIHRLRLEGDLGLAQSLKLRCRAMTDPRSSQVLFFAFLRETPSHSLRSPSRAHVASKDWARGRATSENRHEVTSCNRAGGVLSKVDFHEHMGICRYLHGYKCVVLVKALLEANSKDLL